MTTPRTVASSASTRRPWFPVHAGWPASLRLGASALLLTLVTTLVVAVLTPGTALAAPANDDIAGAIAAGPAPYANLQTDVATATAGVDDPTPSCRAGITRPPTQSVWYKVTGTGSSMVIDTTGSDYDTLIAAYFVSGNTYTEVACNDDGGANNRARLSFGASAGATVYVMVVPHTSNGASGNLLFRVPSPAPSNDAFAGALPADLRPYAATQDVSGATAAADDPRPTCLDVAQRVGQSVWYTTTPTTSGSITVETIGSGYDTVLAVYTGTAGALTEVVCNDDTTGPAGPSLVEFTGTAGTTYWMMVIPYSPGEADSLAFNVRSGPRNDAFADAIVANARPFTDIRNVSQATVSGTDPRPTCLAAGESVGQTVWYRTTPNVSGDVIIDTEGSAYDTVVAVYTGTEGALTQVACDDDSGTGTLSSLTFTATVGTPYSIMVLPYNAGAATDLTLHIRIPPPANDDVDNAIAADARPFTDTRGIGSATTVPDDPRPSCLDATRTVIQSVWYKTTPSTSGSITVDTLGSTYDTVLAVFTGTRGAFTEVACNDQFSGNQSSVDVTVTAGTTYTIMVVPYGPTPSGALTLNVGATVPPPANDAFAGAIVANARPYTNTQSVVRATAAGDDPSPTCRSSGPQAPSQSVWYRTTPSASGSITVDTVGSDYDTLLAVYTGAQGSLTQVACNDDISGSNTRSRVDVAVTAGTTYFILVAPYTAGSGKTLTLNIADVPNTRTVVTAPANQTADEGTAKSFQLGSFTDADGNGPWTVSVNWGDGTAAETFTVTAVGAIGSRAHTYAADGSYTVAVGVADATATGGWAPFTVTVANVAPVLRQPANQVATEGIAKTFSLSYFTDPGADDTTWTTTVTWGDGTAAETFTGPYSVTGASRSVARAHTYGGSGTYTATVTVTDGDGGASAARTFTVTVANVAPVLRQPVAQTASEGLARSFSLSYFTDAGTDDTVWTTTVAWGDGTAPESFTGPYTLSGASRSIFRTHAYGGSGTYTATVTVTDDDGGASATRSFTVTVANVVPNLRQPAAQTASAGVAKSFNLSYFSDPGTDDTVWTTTVTWGDGTAAETFTGPYAVTLPNRAIFRTHTYAAAGTFTATVKVTDDDGGASATRSFTVTVAASTNAVPVVTPAAAQTGSEGTARPYALGSFTDANGNGPWTVRVTWGDGTAVETFTANAVGSLGSRTHTYGPDGVYTVSLTVTDAAGGVSAAKTFTATVANVAPVLRKPADQTATAGVSKTFSLSYLTDPGTDDTSWTVTVVWGDGTPNTVLTGAGTVSGASHSYFAAHTYATAGTKTATVRAVDGDGGASATQPFTVTVTAPANALPVVTPPANQTGSEGTAKSLPLGSFTDANGNGPWTARVTWGDGTAAETFSVASAGSLGNRTHTYGADGAYTATVTVTDAAGGASAAKTFTVTVANVAPVLRQAPAQTAVAGVSKTFNLSYLTDPGTDDTWTVTVVWGDGTPDTVLTTPSSVAGGSRSYAAAHTYATGGTKTATVRAVDSDGAASATQAFTVTVATRLTVANTDELGQPLVGSCFRLLAGTTVVADVCDAATGAGSPADGRVAVDLAPGTYTLRQVSVGRAGYALAADRTVVVGAGPTQTETVQNTPAAGGGTIADPALELDKAKSKFNGLVTATLTGFAPSSAVTLRWPHAVPTVDGDAGTDVLATGATDADGRATLTFRTPLGTLGDYEVTAEDAAGARATATLRVIPRLALNETRGGPDQRLRVYLYGFAAGDRVEVRWHAGGDAASPFVVVDTLTVAANGRASALLPVPADQDAGRHLIVGKVVDAPRSASTPFTLTAASEPPTATPTATATATPAASPTATPVPTGTPEPTATATPAPAPTDTPTPEPTETPTPEPTETPTPTSTPVPNASPTADAGDDATVYDEDGDGAEAVPLDGSASADPEGGPLAYAWSVDGVVVSTEAAPTLTLPLGTTSVTLAVTDAQGATAADEVVITVAAPPAEEPDAEEDSAAEDAPAGDAEPPSDG